MLAVRILTKNSQPRFSPLLRPSPHTPAFAFSSSLLRTPPTAIYNTSHFGSTITHLGRNTILPLVIYGSRHFTARVLLWNRHHWKRWVTGGALCGGLLAGLALRQNHMAAPPPSLCKSLVQDGCHFPMHQAHVADGLTYCEATFSQFTLKEKLYVILRCIYLSCLFTPGLVIYGLSRLLRSSQLETLAWSYTMQCAQAAGPAFIKLGQWASTRRDLFSTEFCNSLSQLHTYVQPHKLQDTLETLEEEFGSEWRDTIEISSSEPIGSGCVAQVYKGTLKKIVSEGVKMKDGRGKKEEGEESRFLSQLVKLWLRRRGEKKMVEEEKVEERETESRVAIKVLHPGTVQAMERDMLLMRYAAYWMDWLHPDFHWVALKECFTEFSIVMRKQLDMELEAYNLLRFQQIMGDNEDVRFPTPLFPYVTKRVLVETFEPGSHISCYMDNPGGKLQKALARIGTDALLDMLFIHNFVHGDLHPGNILVQEDTSRPRLVLLDCGIATSLTHFDLLNMRALFTAIVKGDGVQVADLMLGSQTCSSVEQYRRDMDDLVTRGIRGLTKIQDVEVSNLFSELFNVLMKHKVRIEPNYTSVVMAIMVIEGLGRSLDPSLNLLEAVTPCLLHRVKRDLTNRIIGS